MKISALRLFNVKRFAGRGVAIEGIGDGVNVLCAANEFGKSTSFEALHALFFQPHSGTPGEVQRLRPYSGGSPLIEADIATGDGQFRLAKQYYGGKRASVTDLATGRLVAQADEAENLITNLIRGGAAGPAGLLWVRQGITDMDRRGKPEDRDKQLRAGLLESVQGEVEAVTGGRRMARILEACTEELALLVTPSGRPKAGAHYANAIEDHERLALREKQLAGEVAALREALDKRTSALKRLNELDEPGERQARRVAIDRAQTALEAAKAQGEKLKAADAELKLVRETVGSRRRDLTAFCAAKDEAERLRVELASTEQQRLDALDRRHETRDLIENATAAGDATEKEWREGQELLARLDAAMKARQASEQLAELKLRLAEADATRTALEAKEAELSLLTIPAGRVEELKALELEIARLRAVEEVSRPTVVIKYDAGVEHTVTLDGQPLADGLERSYESGAALVIPGIGAIALHSNRPAHSDKRLNQSERRQQDLLTELGLDSLAGAYARQVEAQRTATERDGLRNQIRLLAPDGLPALRETVARLIGLEPEMLELKGDPEQLRTAVAEADQKRMAARNVLREIEPQRETTEAAYFAAEAKAVTLKAEMARVDAILGPHDSRAERERLLVDAMTALEADLAAAESTYSALRASSIDLESAKAVLSRAKSVEEAMTKETSLLRETIAELNGLIRRSSDDAVEEELREVQERRQAAEQRVEAFAKEVEVLQRLQTALETSRSAARDHYMKPVMTELRPLLELLFEDVSVAFDEKTLLPHAILRNGQLEDVDRLSGGMREQLSVLTRLAFARLLARDGRPTPVILDDALVYSDDDRIERMFDALHRQSRDQQILVFSCRQRAFRELGGRRLDMTDWTPQS